MNASLVTSWITDRQLNTICWTLFHSLWIGVIIAVLAAFVIVYTRKASPALRYQLFCALLLLFVTSTTYTYYCELGSSPANTLSVLYAHWKGTISAIVVTNGYSIFHGFVAFVNQYSPAIVSIWLVCLTIHAIRLCGGLLYSRQISRRQVIKPGGHWQDLVDKVCNSLGIEQKVMLLLSKRISIPVAIGLFKPIILLPAGVLLQLSPEQLEAVLWHELVHIRRHDYLVNILQRIIETIFFFNPALLWLSALIREEREACCDDVVLRHINKKSNYLEALMAFHQRHHAPPFAMQLRNGVLMERLRRMVHEENKHLGWAEKAVLMSSMLLLCSFSFLYDNSSPINKNIQDARHAVISFVRPVLPLPTALAIEKPDTTANANTLNPTKEKKRLASGDGQTIVLVKKDNQADRNTRRAPGKKRKKSTPNAYDLSTEQNAFQKAERVIAALTTAAVVRTSADIEWYVLNYDQLVVNGYQQSDELHQKLVAEFNINQTFGIYYGATEIHGKGLIIEPCDLKRGQ